MQKIKKKVAIIGTNGLPASYGGFETMTNYLTKKKRKDFDFYVFCGKSSKKIKSYNGAKLIYLPFNANGSQSIIYDAISILISWYKYDVLVILGTPGIFILPLLMFFKKTKTIINFGGLEWKRDKWNIIIKKYLKISERIAIKFGTHIVADNKFFCDYIYSEYGKNSELIEYGGDHASKLSITSELMDTYSFLGKEYAISVSRAQPDNNLHLLLQAYSKIPDKILVLVSNWDKFEYGISLKKMYSVFPNIFTLDAVYDLKILDVLRSNASVYIHSHTYCGTAPSLVEAMHIGLPIFSFNTQTNIETTENKALFFSDSNDLISLINNTSKNKLRLIGQHMSRIAQKRYKWDIITNKYAKLFNL